MLTAAQKLADILRQKKAFTNTATFDLKCEVCDNVRLSRCRCLLHAIRIVGKVWSGRKEQERTRKKQGTSSLGSTEALSNWQFIENIYGWYHIAIIQGICIAHIVISNQTDRRHFVSNHLKEMRSQTSFTSRSVQYHHAESVGE